MASIGAITVSRGSTSESTSQSFVEVNESGAVTSGVTYYVLCHALISGADSDNLYEWQLRDKDADSVLTGSHLILEPSEASFTQSYIYVGKFVASGTDGLAFEQRITSEDYQSSPLF